MDPKKGRFLCHGWSYPDLATTNDSPCVLFVGEQSHKSHTTCIAHETAPVLGRPCLGPFDVSRRSLGSPFKGVHLVSIILS